MFLVYHCFVAVRVSWLFVKTFSLGVCWPILLRGVQHSRVVFPPKPALAAQKVSQMRLSFATTKTPKLSQTRFEMASFQAADNLR